MMIAVVFPSLEKEFAKLTAMLKKTPIEREGTELKISTVASVFRGFLGGDIVCTEEVEGIVMPYARTGTMLI